MRITLELKKTILGVLQEAGRRLSSAPRKGVYVRDGKKFVKR